MTGFDGGSAAHGTLDRRCDTSLLTRDEDPELVIRRRVVAAVSLVEEEPLDDVADELFHVWDNVCSVWPS